jgi:RNA polymerase sigma factor (sigma-70 family)
MRYNLPTMADVDAVLGRTMDAIVETIHRFDGTLSFEAFIYSAAFREVAYFYHHRRHSGTLAILESAGRNPSDAAADVDPGRFYETLAQLPDQSRQAMLLRYRVGFSVDEVARILGQSYNATCSLLRQGQRQFGITADDVGAKAA